MSTTARKPTAPHTPGHKGSLSASTTDNGTNGTSKTPSKSPNTANGIGRSPSLRQSPVSARAAARRPGTGRSNLSMSNVPRVAANTQPADDDLRAENAALIEGLKEQLQKAETVSDQFQKQLGVLQMKLDEAVEEQAKLEEQVHERDSKMETLQTEIREQGRQLRDMEQAHETERTAIVRDKEQQAGREDELQSTIQRLKETIAQKDLRMNVDATFRTRSSPDVDNGQFAPSSQLERSPSRANAKLILQKDKLIESLRLELAESQIKLVEMENMGGGRQRELERELLEARMANARLMEDNESYQLLLSEKTLNGDFSKGDFMQDVAPGTKESTTSLGSLADELESAGENDTAVNESDRKVDSEVRALKDQNKALTLYIERIIGRLLQHDGFEKILDKSDNPLSTTPRPEGKDKELPPPPPEKDDQKETFLQRARSVVGGPGTRPKPTRPVSAMPPPAEPIHHIQTAHEDPNTAPSIPLGRNGSVRAGHRRSRSDQIEGAAAVVVGQMYRGSAFGRSPSGGPISPVFSPTMGPSSRPSSVLVSNPTNGRITSLSSHSGERAVSGSASVASDRSGEMASTEGTSSPPRSNSGMNNYTGAVMTQNKLRPLRLVQENKEMESGDQGGRSSEDEDAARKKANRGSWISWFKPKEGEENGTKSPPPS